MAETQLAKKFRLIFESMSSGDYDNALTLMCTLIDRAGKETYKIDKNRWRITKIINENTDFLIWFISAGQIRRYGPKSYHISFTREGKKPLSLGDIIYKCRNDLLHEAELSDEIVYGGDQLGIVNGKIHFPQNLVWALAFMLITLECYKNHCPENYFIAFDNHHFPLSQLWGNREIIMAITNRH